MADIKLSTEKKVMIIAALLLIACGVFYYYYTSPIKKELTAVQEEVSLLNIQVTAAQQYVGRLAELNKEAKRANLQLEELKQMLPDRRGTPAVIRQTHKMAVDSGLRMTGFTPGAIVEHEYYEAWPIQLTMEGTFHSLSMFFEKTGNFSRIISIEDLEITAVTKDARPDKTIQASCQANTYVYIN